LPFYDHDARRTVWYPPEDLPSDDTPAILFLDELTAAAPTLQPTIYGLLQERRVGAYCLPASTFVVAAGNAVEDGAVAYEMGTALSDRLIHLSIRAEAQDWLTGYAVPRGLHPAVAAFIRTRPDLLDTTEDALRQGATIACTPRSWARVSEVLAAMPDRAMRDVMVAGILGEGPGAEFLLVLDDIAATVEATGMLEATATERLEMYPQSLHGLTALVYALVALANRDTLPAAIEVLAQVRHLARDRREDVFARLPLGELTTYGFELLIEKALANGWQEVFRTSRAYAAYAEDRAAQ
ncbi:MAG: ATPase, partial [Pseudomonadota bacterium]